MAIIRDDKGNIYNIPDTELKQYLVVKTVKAHPEKLCLDPKFDAQRGPHDGWEYIKPGAKPKVAAKKTAAKKSTRKPKA